MSVTLTFGSSTVVLPSPDFGNAHRLEFDRISRKTRGGDLIVYRDPAWPKNETLTFGFSFITQAKANTLLAFLKASLGQDIELTDHEGRDWVGVITTPAGDVSQPNRDGFSASFEFQGSPT